MRIKSALLMLLLFGLSFAVAAQDDEDFPYDILEIGNVEFTDVELAIDENFRDDDDWEPYESNDGFALVDDGAFQVQHEIPNSNLWGQNEDEYSDIVIMVEAEQLSDYDQNGYGVMCRASSEYNFDGYLFYISGDGYTRVSKTVDGELEVLSDWNRSESVNQGQEENELIVVCIEDYLALYVNGELAVEVRDDTYDEGAIGFSALYYIEDEDDVTSETIVHVSFDNLMVWEVEGDIGDINRNDDDNDNDDHNTDSSLDIDDIQEDVEDALEEGDEQIDLEDVLLIEEWDRQGDWSETDDDDSTVEVDDDVYVFEQREEDIFYSGSYPLDMRDAVMTVTVEQTSDMESSGYGMMCRVDPDNRLDGYAFVVTVAGDYFMGYWDGNDFETVEEGRFRDLETGEDEINQLTIVCVDEYFAFYVNGELVDEFEDDTYDEGYIGLAIVSFERDEVSVAFDNLVVWEADN